MDALKQRRKNAGLTREQLAVAAGLTGRTVERIELGLGNPTLSTLEALAKVLGCRVADLLSNNGDAS